MRTIISALLLSFSLCNSYSQTEWFSINTKERSGDKKLKQVIQIVNDNSKELVTFFQYYNFFVAYLNNSNGELINVFSANALPKFKNNYLGTSINNDTYTLFFQNDYGTKFSALNINFKTSKFEYNNKLVVQSNIESVIGSFEYKSHIYLLTSEKKSSKLHLYKFINHTEITVKTFDFSETEFVTPRGFTVTLDRFLDNGYDSSTATLIENNEPGALESSSRKNKLFLDGETLVLTNDLYNNATTFISINLENGNSKYLNFPKSSFNKKDRASKSNSFVLDNYFFNFYVTRDYFDFSIYNVNTQDLIKSYKVTENESITFKNSPIILEKGDFEKYRELSRTKQFLRKVSRSNAGIYAYNKDGNFVITLGANDSEIQGNELAALGVFVGGLPLGVMIATLTPSYESYTGTKSTRIECLFDESFNSINGSIPENVFDKINNYIRNNSTIKFKHKSIFKANNNYIIGYYSKETGLYNYILMNN